MAKKPVIGITIGDPNGIGPEIVVKSLSCLEIKGICTPTVFGSRKILNEVKRILALSTDFETVDFDNFDTSDLKAGNNDRRAGQAALDYIEHSVDYALQEKVDAIVTAPISKKSIHLTGSSYPGHTEMLSDLTGSDKVAMMFEGNLFRVVLVTIHRPLSEIPRLINFDNVFNTIKLTHKFLIELFAIPNPTLVVCGLNPHAGESGAFGTEEIKFIKPAVNMAKEDGIRVEGPLPSDTLFYMAAKGKWDAVIAMYHDQGLIPFKMVSFKDGVNITLGLPIIRTSPDHGTAFDIAWKALADPSSMIAAIKTAVRLAENKKRLHK